MYVYMYMNIYAYKPTYRSMHACLYMCLCVCILGYVYILHIRKVPTLHWDMVQRCIVSAETLGSVIPIKYAPQLMECFSGNKTQHMLCFTTISVGLCRRGKSLWLVGQCQMRSNNYYSGAVMTAVDNNPFYWGWKPHWEYLHA